MKKVFLFAVVAVVIAACSAIRDVGNQSPATGSGNGNSTGNSGIDRLTQAELAGNWQFVENEATQMALASAVAGSAYSLASDGTVHNEATTLAANAVVAARLTTAQIGGSSRIEATRGWIVGNPNVATPNFNFMTRNGASDIAANVEPNTAVLEIHYTRAGVLSTRSLASGTVQPFPRWVKVAIRTNGRTVSMYSSQILWPGSATAAGDTILNADGTIDTTRTFEWATRPL